MKSAFRQSNPRQNGWMAIQGNAQVTDAAIETEALATGLKAWLRGIWGAVLIAALTVAFTISFTAIIYNGPLSPFLGTGIGLSLLGGAMMCAIGSFFYTYRGTICHPQDVTAIVLAVSASAMALSWPEGQDNEEALLATVAMLVAISTLLAGIVAYVFGYLRLGFLARFIPYPVVGGFLAATGYLLLTGSIGMGLGINFTIWDWKVLLVREDVLRWLPWVAIGGVITWASRRYRNDMILPTGLILSLLGFYIAIALAGMDLAAAGDAGLLLGPFTSGSFLSEVSPVLVVEADWWAIANEAPMLIAVALLTIIGTLLHATGLELTLDRELNLETDLRATGIANIAGAFGGGMIGFQLMSGTMLGKRLGLHGVLPGIAASAGCLITLIFGGDLLSVLPVGVFVAVIAYLGIDLLVTWLWSKRSQLSKMDWVLILLILAVAATVGFFEALAVGMLAAAGLFIVSFARVEVVRLRSTVATRRSLVERSDGDLAYLMDAGRQAVVLELTGYLFFGTANTLLERIRAEVNGPQPPRYIIVDFTRVHGLDASVAYSLGKLSRFCARSNVELLFSGMTVDMEDQYVKGTGELNSAGFASSLNDALQAVEADLLAERNVAQHPAGEGLLQELLALSKKPEFAGKFEKVALDAGDLLISQGADSNEMFILISGAMRAEVDGSAGQKVVVARFMPGAPIGEIAFYGSVPRTASVLAEEPSILLKIDAAHLVTETGTRTAATIVHHYAAVHLSRRLMNMTRLLRDADL
jgi:SulP family sulfate permease